MAKKTHRTSVTAALAAEWDDYVGSTEHLPAWLKDVYLDPEATGTSG
jgi:hypothetical protein